MTATEPMLSLPPCDHKPKHYTGPSKAELIAMRQQYTNPAIFTLYKDPLLIVEGHMQYLFDETGRRYLDCLAGIVTIGIGHAQRNVMFIVKCGRRGRQTQKNCTSIGRHALQIRASITNLLAAVDSAPLLFWRPNTQV